MAVSAIPEPSDSRPGSPDHTAGSVIGAALETMRPYQWLKNILVFIPLAAAHRLADRNLLCTAVCTFVAFSLCASSIYVFNDLHDAPADRLHPRKRFRPIAFGALPRSIAIGLVPLLLAGAIVACLPLGSRVAALLVGYMALMVAYSLTLKSIVLLDVLVLAAGFALRVIVGAVAVNIVPSAQLLEFCMLLFFSLALVKRYAELALLRVRDGPAAHARAYRLDDQEVILALGSGSGILSVVSLTQFMGTASLERLDSRFEFICMTSVLLLYWICHVWLTAHRGRMTDDPLVFAIKDRVSQILIVLMGVAAWLAV
ncbi:MAG: UbiA family prenyltransferase [Steroidobacteraceae bacterium]